MDLQGNPLELGLRSGPPNRAETRPCPRPPSPLGAERASGATLGAGFDGLTSKLEALAQAAANGERMPGALATTVARMGQLYEQTLAPLVSATHHKIRLDHGIWENAKAMGEEVERIRVLLDGTRPSQASKKGAGKD